MQKHIFSVSELNSEVAELLRSGFTTLCLEGELSNFSKPASGHFYFSMKDNKAQLRCAMFKSRNRHINFQPISGMKVIAYGRVALYEPRGDFQFIVDSMEEVGEGALHRQFHRLKQRLKKEGLFDSQYKLVIPLYPQCVGVISSATGAAIQDIYNVLKRRSPHVVITLYPVTVQGAESALQISKAINKACSENRCDILILSRGGGSLEDLWAFNEEVVARAIANATIPIISGIGHEIDFTIADFVADVRAPTPSAAAEVAVPDRLELIAMINRYEQLLHNGILATLKRRKEQLEMLTQRLQRQRIDYRLEYYQQRLDEVSAKQQKLIELQLNDKQQQLNSLYQRLRLCSPKKGLKQQQANLLHLKHRLVQSSVLNSQQKQAELTELASRLQAVSPLSTLRRGYSVVRKEGKLVKSIKHVAVGDTLQVTLNDGELSCILDSEPLAFSK